MKKILIGLGLGAIVGIAAYKKIEESKLCEKAIKCAEKKLKECE